MNRENIYQSLFLRAAAASWAALPPAGTGATAFKTASRKFIPWDQVQPENMPALYQVQMREAVTRKANQPALWTLSVRWYVYVTTLGQQDAGVVPSQYQNPILDALQAALEPQPADGDLIRNTLGKLAYEAKLAGEIINFEGDLGDLGVFIMPVEIVVPF